MKEDSVHPRESLAGSTSTTTWIVIFVTFAKMTNGGGLGEEDNRVGLDELDASTESGGLEVCLRLAQGIRASWVQNQASVPV